MYKREDIEKALTALKNGGVILYPTETVWGLGCDATDAAAVKRIFEIKKRSDSKAMISLVDSLDSLYRWVETIPAEAVRAIEESDSPVSIIYDSPKGIAEELKAEDGSAAFRITTLPFTAELVRELGHPLVSSSANISGSPTPLSFTDIESGIKNAVDYITEYGRDRKGGTPSSVLKITNDGKTIKLR